LKRLLQDEASGTIVRLLSRSNEACAKRQYYKFPSPLSSCEYFKVEITEGGSVYKGLNDGTTYSVVLFFHLREGVCLQGSPLNSFVTTVREHAAKPGVARVAKPYLIRSYDHEKRTAPNQPRITTRRSTRQATRSDTEGSTRQATRSDTEGSTRQATRSNTEKSGDIDGNVADRKSVNAQRKINYESAQSFPIWQVARAATAAPAYFEPLRVETPGSSAHSVFTDAGLGVTINPTQEGILEIKDLYKESSIGVVVSVGTAKRRELWGGGIRRPMKALASMVADPEVIHNNMQKESVREGFPYYRLNDPDKLNIELDEWEPKQRPWSRKVPGSTTLGRMTAAFNDWARKPETAEQFERCANELVKRRQARTNDCAKWERYAIGVQFRCRRKECEREDFDNRGEFYHHLSKDHDMPQDGLDEETSRCMRRWQYRGAATSRIH
jgi:hypothetical protein